MENCLVGEIPPHTPGVETKIEFFLRQLLNTLKCSTYNSFHSFNKYSFFKDFIYLFMRDTESEAETQAEVEARSLWEA